MNLLSKFFHPDVGACPLFVHCLTLHPKPVLAPTLSSKIAGDVQREGRDLRSCYGRLR